MITKELCPGRHRRLSYEYTRKFGVMACDGIELNVDKNTENKSACHGVFDKEVAAVFVYI